MTLILIRRWQYTFCALTLVGGCATAHAAGETDAAEAFRVPAGFDVSLYAGDELAHNVYSMTIDARGNVVVAGPGYVKTLHDDDGDGRADRATPFSEVPKSGAQGMYFDGANLLCTGDGGLLLLRDKNGDGRADGRPEVWAELKNPEHGSHAVLRGPDGWFYVACGNDAGVDARHVTSPRSPVDEPTAGAVLRISPDGRQSEVIAHGFRNPYDLAFDARGRLLCVDADGERAHHLPWYMPSRLFDVAMGMHHGWMQQGWTGNWARPEYFFDNVPRAAELGRGSPTGLVSYQHRHLPPHYRGGLFSACWTLGRVYFLRLRRHAASYETEVEVFMQTAGDVGFAPVDLEVGPEGDLFVAIGGRGTKGGVFRIHYRDAHEQTDVQRDVLEQVLSAPQPLASWSRARWMPRASGLGRAAFKRAAANTDRGSAAQCRAIEILTELFGGLDADFARRLVRRDDARVVARVAWSLGRVPKDNAASLAILAELTRHSDASVARAAWEALIEQPTIPPDLKPAPDWLAAMDSTLRRIRSAAVLVARTRGAKSFRQGVDSTGRAATARQKLSYLWVDGPSLSEIPEESEPYFDTCIDVFHESRQTVVRLEAVRLIQIGLGDIRARSDGPQRPGGYVAVAHERLGAKEKNRLTEELGRAFPTGDEHLDRELSRLYAMLEADVPGLLDTIAARWTEDSSPVDDVHYLIVASMLPGQRTAAVTKQTAAALAGLHAKLARQRRSTSRTWPLYVGDALDRLLRRDPKLGDVLVALPEFGRVEHSLFAARLEGQQRQAAARKLLATASAAEDDVPWTSGLVAVLASLSDEEIFPALRARWEDPVVTDAITLVLARSPRETDRERFVEALDSPQADVVAQAASALTALAPPDTLADMAAAVGALRRFCTVGDDRALARALGPVREALVTLLAHGSGARIEIDEPDAPEQLLAAYSPWFEWFARRHPEAAAGALGTDGFDASDWRRRLNEIDFTRGDARRGKLLFEKQGCHRCHVESGRLGPDLRGAVRRMGRDDLFTAIVDPNREVSPAYRTTAVLTDNGRVYHGLLVYESPEATLLQTAADTTVRITQDELAAILPSRRSLMPTALLDGVSDEDLTDLYAYLLTLAGE